MPRYIDADAFVQAEIERCGSQPVVGTCTMDNEYLSIRIAAAPTLSPDDVRGEGKWEKDSDGLDVCSECGEVALQRVFIKLPDKIVNLQMVRSKFCPNCGARLEVSEDA